MVKAKNISIAVFFIEFRKTHLMIFNIKLYIKKKLSKLMVRVKNCLFKSKTQTRLISAKEDLQNGIEKPKSVLFFTTHKCASTFISNLLQVIADNSNYLLFDYPGGLYDLGNRIDAGEPYDFLSECSSYLFKPKGEIYGPLRKPIYIEARELYKHIFFLRDPRDVLVSAYYSFGYSHVLPSNNKRRAIFVENRQKIQSEKIDQYVLRAVDEWIIPLYEQYILFRKELKNTLFLSYDDYISNPKNFVQSLTKYLNLSAECDAVQRFVENIRPVQTNAKFRVMEHQRSGSSRQFEYELSSNTQDILNQKLENILKFWGFHI